MRTEIKYDEETGDLLVEIPPCILEELGWDTGDTLTVTSKDGAIHLEMKDEGNNGSVS